MSAVFPIRGNVRQLDRATAPEEQITPEDVTDSARLVRIVMRILKDLAAVKRRWAPHHLDFEDQVFDATGTKKFRLEHRLGGRVRYWIVDWSGSAAPNLRKDTSTDGQTLVLTSTVAGTATVRVELSG